MEHIKLAHCHPHHHKHREGGVRCWVVAATLALAVTFVFVGITLWLGLSAATRQGDMRLSQADLGSTLAHGPGLPTRQQPRPLPAPRAPHAPATHPSAPHSNKKRKGQVEKVQLDGVSSHAEEPAPASVAPPTTSTTSTSTTTTSTTTTTTTTTAVPEVEGHGSFRPLQPDHTIGDMTEEDALFPKLDANLESHYREVLSSGVPPPAPPPRMVRPQPPTPPPRVWSPQAEMGPWSPPLELRPPAPRRPPAPAEARHPMLHGDPAEDLVAEAASAPEWRQPAERRQDALQDLDEPYHYDGVKPEEAENPLFNFVQDRMSALKDWLVVSNAGQDWQDMLQAVNMSLHRADPSLVLRKLKDMYYNTSVEPDVPLASLVYPTDPAVLSNSSSLVSFGLLAFDLLLLRNVQLLARGEDGDAGQRAEQLLRDPEVRALSALFLPPQEVRRQLVHGQLTQDAGE